MSSINKLYLIPITILLVVTLASAQCVWVGPCPLSNPDCLCTPKNAGESCSEYFECLSLNCVNGICTDSCSNGEEKCCNPTSDNCNSNQWLLTCENGGWVQSLVIGKCQYTGRNLIIDCTLNKAEDCGKGAFNLICDEKECTDCGWYFTPKNVKTQSIVGGSITGCVAGGWFFGLLGCGIGVLLGGAGGSLLSGTVQDVVGGTCSATNLNPDNLSTCETCEKFAMSEIFGSFSKSNKCIAKQGSLVIGVFESLFNGLLGKVLPQDYPQTYTTCAFSFVKLLLVVIVLIFGFLYILQVLPNYLKILKGKNKRFMRIILSGFLAIILAYLIYIAFWVGLILFIILIAIKQGFNLFKQKYNFK